MSLMKYATEIDDFKAKLKSLENCRFPLWETEKIADFVAFAIEKLSPAQLGELVELVDAPDIDKYSGWWQSRHTLVVGRRGYVREIDWRDGQFVFAWEPLNQTWISSLDGAERPSERTYLYHLAAKRFVRVSAGDAGEASGEEAMTDTEKPIELRPVVRWFAEQMELRLRRAKNERKGGWHECDPRALLDRVAEETQETREALERALTAREFPCQDNVVREAADVANMAMMVADHFREGGPSPDQGKTL